MKISCLSYQKQLPVAGEIKTAGTAAALAVREKCAITVLNTALLRDTLIAQGAII